MPILADEVHYFPERLFEATVPPEPAERHWHVTHVFPRQEKALARTLCERETSFYLPRSKRCSRSGGRKFTSYLPLFPGYVFVFANPSELAATLTTGRVIRVLEVKDQLGLWNDLHRVHRLLASGLPVTPEERWGPGTKVTIQAGSLRGLEGAIVRTATGSRFVVQVDFLQRGASVLIDDSSLAATL